MTIYPLLNIIASLIVAGIIAYKLTARVDKFTVVERLGMGMIGAGSILTIGPLMSVEPTPFEDWSATLLRIGCAVYFYGRMTRHHYNNAAARRQARTYLNHRGLGK